jgi:hypothetical protein
LANVRIAKSRKDGRLTRSTCVDALAWQQRAAIRTHMTQRVAQQTLIERMAALKAEYGVTVWRVP